MNKINVILPNNEKIEWNNNGNTSYKNFIEDVIKDIDGILRNNVKVTQGEVDGKFTYIISKNGK